MYAAFGRPRNSSQARVTAVTKPTGNYIFEASPLLRINDTTQLPLLTNCLFESETLQHPSRKQGVIWPFHIIEI
jgi:hypothetical protein